MNQDSWAKRFSAWGSLIVTVAIYGLLGAGLWFSARTENPPQAFSNLMETIKALAMIAGGFWLGSSNSSQKKDETNAAAMTALANSVPSNVVAFPAELKSPADLKRMDL